MDTTMVHDEVVHVTLLAARVPVTIKVFSTYLTVIDFSLYGSLHTFTIKKWRSSQFTGFFKRFHVHTVRDAAKFGSMTMDAEGACTFHADVHQKVAAVLQAAKDVISCLDRIAEHHKSAILDYATWYREAHKEEDSYAELITRITCHLIVHTGFFSPNIHWDLVQFV